METGQQENRPASLHVKPPRLTLFCFLCLGLILACVQTAVGQHGRSAPPPGAVRLGQPPVPSGQMRTPPPNYQRDYSSDEQPTQFDMEDSLFDDEQSGRVVKRGAPPVITTPIPVPQPKRLTKNYDMLEEITAEDIRDIESRDPKNVTGEDWWIDALWHDRKAQELEKPLVEVKDQLATISNNIDSAQDRFSANSSEVDKLKEKRSQLADTNEDLKKKVPDIDKDWFGKKDTSPTYATVVELQDQLARYDIQKRRPPLHLVEQLNRAQKKWDDETANMKFRLKWLDNCQKSEKAVQKIAGLVAENDRITENLQALYRMKRDFEYKKSKLETQTAIAKQRRDSAMEKIEASIEGNKLFWALVQKANPDFVIKPASTDAPKPVDKAQEMKLSLDRQKDVRDQWNEYVTRKFEEQKSSVRQPVSSETVTISTKDPQTDWSKFNLPAVTGYSEGSNGSSKQTGIQKTITPGEINIHLAEITGDQSSNKVFQKEDLDAARRGFTVSSLGDPFSEGIPQELKLSGTGAFWLFDLFEAAPGFVVQNAPTAVGIGLAIVDGPAALAYGLAFGTLSAAQYYAEGGHTAKQAIVYGVVSTAVGFVSLGEATVGQLIAKEAVFTFVTDTCGRTVAEAPLFQGSIPTIDSSARYDVNYRGQRIYQ